VYDAAEDLFRQLDRLHAMLSDASKTSVRLVLNPEKMVVKEAQRTYTYLNLFGYPTDLVVCNRMLPARVTDHYFDAWKATQALHREAVTEGFAPLPILDVPLFDHEIVGVERLRGLAEALYGDQDPSTVMFQGQGHRIEKRGGEYELSLTLPFAGKEDVALYQTGDELVVKVGSQKRNLILPRALVGWRTNGARFAEGALRIRFVPGEPVGAERSGA
jgi:arsenite-transporting ATPase